VARHGNVAKAPRSFGLARHALMPNLLYGTVADAGHPLHATMIEVVKPLLSLGSALLYSVHDGDGRGASHVARPHLRRGRLCVAEPRRSGERRMAADRPHQGRARIHSAAPEFTVPLSPLDGSQSWRWRSAPRCTRHCDFI
jgi:hypothetical protein